jgi:MFS transporter, FHS family, glucose/mannose:H+ symporter
MHTWKIKLSLFLNYFVFAILLNSVGTVILQVQNNYGISQGDAAVLEAFKDLSIAVVSFLISSFIVRIGYRNAMLIALGFITIVSLLMPSLNGFWATKLLFASVGACFALIKMSVYSTIGIVTKSEKEHISLMSFIESFFMIGILTGYFIFGYFVDDTNTQSTNWLKVYYFLGGLSAIAFLLLLSSPLDESGLKNDARNGIGEFTAMFKLLSSPLVLVFICCAFFYVLIEQSIMSWLPTFNNKVLLLPAALSIQMASILAGSTALGRFLAGIVLKRINWLFALIGCLIAAAALVLLAIPLADNAGGKIVTGWGDAPIAAFIFPLIGLLLAPIYPAINSIILSTLPANKHGLMSGLIIVFSALGGTTGSIITGNIFEQYGGQAAFYFSLVPITILVISLFFFKKLQSKVA